MDYKSLEKVTSNMVGQMEMSEETIATIKITIIITITRGAFNMLLQERAHISISKELEMPALMSEALVLPTPIVNSMDQQEDSVPFTQDQAQLVLVKVQLQETTLLLRDNKIEKKRRKPS